MSQQVVVLAGGTGGAKLARGMLDVVGSGGLNVIANTGDDIEIYGAYVSPDPDLVTFWLADQIDERGWGLEGDSFRVMDGLRAMGRDIWFNLGDRDLAIGLERAAALDRGERLTEAQRTVADELGVSAGVIPMSDRPVRTRVLSGGRWWGLQEFLIKARTADGWPAVQDVDFKGARRAGASPEALAAVAQADAVIIGPSNPIISIGPILSIPPLREALIATAAPVVAVSPLPKGRVVKGPTAEFMAWRGLPCSGEGIALLYEGLLDGLVADGPVDGVPTLPTELLMEDAEARRRLASETLQFALGLRHAAGGAA